MNIWILIVVFLGKSILYILSLMLHLTICGDLRLLCPLLKIGQCKDLFTNSHDTSIVICVECCCGHLILFSIINIVSKLGSCYLQVNSSLNKIRRNLVGKNQPWRSISLNPILLNVQGIFCPHFAELNFKTWFYFPIITRDLFDVTFMSCECQMLFFCDVILLNILLCIVVYMKSLPVSEKEQESIQKASSQQSRN